MPSNDKKKKSRSYRRRDGKKSEELDDITKT